MQKKHPLINKRMFLLAVSWLPPKASFLLFYNHDSICL